MPGGNPRGPPDRGECPARTYVEAVRGSPARRPRRRGWGCRLAPARVSVGRPPNLFNMPDSGPNFYKFHLKMGPNSSVFLTRKCTNFKNRGIGSEPEASGREWRRVEREIGSAASEHACGVQTAAGEGHRRSLLSCSSFGFGGQRATNRPKGPRRAHFCPTCLTTPRALTFRKDVSTLRW